MNTTEEELQKIIKSNKSKNIKINGNNYWISKKVKDEIRKSHMNPEGGLLPLLGLIPGIIAGIAKVGAVAAGATGIASGIAGAVASSRDAIKKQKEIALLDRAAQASGDQQIATTPSTATNPSVSATGAGIYLNPYDPNEHAEGEGFYLTPTQGTAIHKYLKNNSNIPKELTKKFKNGIEIEIARNANGSAGDGIYLNPYRV